MPKEEDSMKDIENHNNELEEVIKTSKQKFNISDKKRKYLYNSVIILLSYLSIVFGFEWLQFNLQNIIYAFSSGAIILSLASASILTINKTKFEAKERQSIIAKNDINNIIFDLHTKGIEAEKNQLQNAIVEIKNTSKTNIYDADNDLMLKEEKIIKYFYLLDKEDQIRVLRQITSAIDNNKTTVYSHTLTLMEDKDLINTKIPVCKVLKLKKDIEK